MKKQTNYIRISIEDELPKEFEIVTFIATVPVDNIFKFANEKTENEIEFVFNGWLENNKFLFHGVGEELNEGKVTHWLKKQEGYFISNEEYKKYETRN